MSCALLSRYPELAAALPHVPLGGFPTPIERVHGLLPPQVELWVKREDLAGTVYGGNKVRKLELLLGDPRLRPSPDGRPPRIVTFGGYGSHHVLAVALYARPLGIDVDAVVFRQPPLPHARETLLCSLAAGARLFPSVGYLGIPWQLLRARLARGAGRPLLVGPGGSSPLGTLGWMSGGLEIAAQVQAGVAPRFDALYASFGSGGTVAGLWLGCGEAAAEIAAVRVVPALLGSPGQCRRLGRRAEALLLPHLSPGRALPPRPRLRVDGRFVGPGYGTETEAVRDAIARAAAVGLALEPTYTGRLVAALLRDTADGRLDGKRVLLLHSASSRDLTRLVASAPARASLPPRLRDYWTIE